MSNPNLKTTIKNLSSKAKHMLTDSLLHPKIEDIIKNDAKWHKITGFICSKVEIAKGIYGQGFSAIMDSPKISLEYYLKDFFKTWYPGLNYCFDEELRKLKDDSLMLIYLGTEAIAGNLPLPVGKAMGNEQVMGFFGGRGAGYCEDVQLPRGIDLLTDEELYGKVVGCYTSGIQHFERWQPDLGWQDSSVTQSIYIDPTMNFNRLNSIAAG